NEASRAGPFCPAPQAVRLRRGFPPDRDVLPAVARERLAPPARPALHETHAGDPGHEVELGRPDVAERARRVLDLVADPREMVRDQPLRGDVVLVDAPVARAEVEDVR